MSNKKTIAIGTTLAAAVVGLLVAKKSRDNDTSYIDVLTDSIGNKLNPVSADPATPLETAAFIESLTPSLMTRSSLHQGAVSGMSVLTAKAVSTITEKVTNNLLGKDDSYANKMATRGVLSISGHIMSVIPEKPNESLIVSSIRSAGRLLEIASLGGAVYDTVTRATVKTKSKWQIFSIMLGALLTTGVLYRGKNMLEERRSLLDTVPQDPTNKILPATAAAAIVINSLKLLGFSMRLTGKLLGQWLGEGPLKSNIARITNLSLWTSLFVGSYWAGVSKIGTANEKVEPSYAIAPPCALVSGSDKSIVTFEQIGMQGRKFVSNTVPASSIKKITGKAAKNTPIRVYIGYNTPEKYQSQRTQMAIEELKRTKAFERKYLLLVSPTGTGWIDHTSVESAELYSGGDIATCVVQYAKYPSFLALQKVRDGRNQFRELLWSIKLITDEMPKSKRPKILVFGLSLGAWASSDAVMHTGIAGFDHYGIDRALWLGMPGLAKWGKNEEGSIRVGAPSGTVASFDRPEQYESLTTKQKEKLRAIILNHDDDPITLLRPKLLIKKPKWLTVGNKGRGVPEKMEWSPIFTFLQVWIDAGNAMTSVPGKFRSHGHDYRGDMAYFVNEAYQFGVSGRVVENTSQYLEQLELKRAQRSSELSSNIR